MKLNIDRVLKHAEERLKISPHGEHQEWVKLFKGFLKIEQHRLLMHHRFGVSGIEIAKNRSLLIDILIRHAYQLLVQAGETQIPPLSLIALGGYGREMLNPHSDIDIMFLLTDHSDAQTEQMVKKILYLLWDIGLKVGHSARTIKDAIRESKRDLNSRTSMTEARFIAGNMELFQKFQLQFQKRCLARDKAYYLKQKLEELKDRHRKYKGSVYLLEPHVKEGVGGLRDLFMVLWIYRTLYGYQSFQELQAHGVFSEKEHKTLVHALDFLMRTRNELHFLTEKAFDILTLSLQPKIAKNLGFKKEGVLQPSESFMRQYYTHARNIDYLSKMALAKQEGFSQLRFLFPKRFVKRQGFCFTEEEVQPGEDPELFKKNPQKLLEVFLHCAQGGYRLSYELLNQVRNHLYLVDRKFQSSKDCLDLFLKIILYEGPTLPALRAMHNSGFLGKYIPEFDKATCFVIHDMYHEFTLDEHSLRAVGFLDELKITEDPTLIAFRQVYYSLENKDVAFFAVFFHDIGKTQGKGHSSKGARMVEEILGRMNYPSEKIARVKLLVAEHLTMVHISQRRNLGEEKVIVDFAKKIEDAENLKVLHLLTYTDSKATGEKVWNDWKEALLWELYLKTKRYLEEKVALLPSEIKELQQSYLEQLLAKGINPEQAQNHIAMLPISYLQSFSPSQVARHIETIPKIEKEDPVVFWEYNVKNNTTELTVCTKDRLGLFSNISGVCAAHLVNILSAEIYTRQDSAVIDKFSLENPYEKSILNEKIRLEISADLKEVLHQNIELWNLLEKKVPILSSTHRASRPPLVTFDHESSQEATIIEIQADDEVGLLFKITKILSDLKLNISYAKISTEKAQVFDVFYVQDQQSHKITDEKLLEKVRFKLEEVLRLPLTDLK